MATKLEEIIAAKKVELEKRKSDVPVEILRKMQRTRPHYSLEATLKRPFSSGIVAEFKRQSPSAGVLNEKAVLEQVVNEYEIGGAAGISVLSNTPYFGGSVADVEHTCQIVTVPVLRKEFIVDDYQVLETERMGADVMLLIADALTPAETKKLAGFARNLNLEVLLEVHEESELDHLCDEITLVGVNSRNLHTFETNLQTALDLAKKIPDGFVKVAESGIKNVDDLIMLRQAGYKGFLIGETFMKEENPGEAFNAFAREAIAKMSIPDYNMR
jgi:indole-3-glycerol phosphate synthase